MRKLLDPTLYYFCVVAQSGSLTAATEKLGATVSALSRHIAKLEGDVGAPLFERKARGMELSHAGRLLLRYAQNSLSDGEAVLNAIGTDQKRHHRRIRIACTEGLAGGFLPLSLSTFYAQHSEAMIEINVASSEEANQMLVDGEVSIALSFSLKPEPDVIVRLSLPAPVMALMHQNHPLAERHALALSDLSDYPMLLPDKGMTVRQLFDLACNVDGVEISTPIVSRSSASLSRLVQVVPGAISLSGYVSVANNLSRNNLLTIPLRNALLHQRRLQVRTSAIRPLPGLAEKFLDQLIEDLRRVHATHPSF